MSSNDSLLKRRAMLESMLQDCAVAGIPVPPERYVELATVVHELDARNVTQHQGKTWMQFLGDKIDGYMLDRLIDEDTYFYLIAGKKIDLGAPGEERVVFKIIKDKELFENPETARLNHRLQALHLVPFQTVPAVPDAKALAISQYSRLKNIGDVIVSPLSSGAETKTTMKLPFLRGAVLKEKIKKFPDAEELAFTLRTFSDAAECLRRLSTEHQSFYHGNLKPSTIVCIEGGVALLEPGYVGPLRDSTGDNLDSCFVSTLAYYPNLDSDDLLALGVALFECITGVHPFQQSLMLQSIEEDFSPTLLDKDLCDEINLKRSLLQPYTTPLYKLQRPVIASSTSNAAMIENCILKGLRLKVGSDGLFHKDEGFADFAAFKMAIDEILILHEAEQTVLEAQESNDQEEDV